MARRRRRAAAAPHGLPCTLRRSRPRPRQGPRERGRVTAPDPGGRAPRVAASFQGRHPGPSVEGCVGPGPVWDPKRAPIRMRLGRQGGSGAAPRGASAAPIPPPPVPCCAEQPCTRRGPSEPPGDLFQALSVV